MAMTLFFHDGFDEYSDVADLTRGEWNNATAVAFVTGRSGSGRAIDTPTGLFKSFGTQTEYIIGIAFKFQSTLDVIFQTREGGPGGTNQMSFDIDATFHLRASYGNALATTTSGATVLAAGNWYYAELAVKHADAGGSVRVHLNGISGSPEINVSGVDTLNGGAGPDGLRINEGSATFDDLYIKAGTGWVVGDFLGDVRVDTKYVTANGDFAQWTPGGSSPQATNYLGVDEAQMNEGTDTNDSAAVGDRDCFPFQQLPTTVATVHAVRLVIEAEKLDATTRQVGIFWREGGANYDDPTVLSLSLGSFLTKAYQLNADPSGAAWTRLLFNNGQAGYRSVA
jgi:hypothetical protein